MATLAEQIQELYIGLLGRAGERAGVDYWTEEIEKQNISIEGVRENIVKYQPEYQQGLGSMNREGALNELYLRLFNREPDAEGFIYWAQGDGGAVSFDQLILALSNGAHPDDRLILDNKSEAAQFYTDTIPIDQYTLEGSRAAVSSVDGTPESVAASKAKTLSAVDIQGETKTLTATPETLIGTDKQDAFLGTASDVASIEDTFNAGDLIDGLGAIDSMNITVTGTNNESTLVAADVKNVELINVRALLTDTETITKVEAYNFVGATDFYADRATSYLTFLGLAQGQSAGIKGNGVLRNGSLSVEYLDSGTDSVINLSGGIEEVELSLSGAGITTTTINSSGSDNILDAISFSADKNEALIINAESRFSVASMDSLTVSSITISGDALDHPAASYNTRKSAVALGYVSADVDASGLTRGGVDVQLRGREDVIVIGGNGFDSIQAGAVLTTGSVDAGAGDSDELIITNSKFIETSALGAKYSNFEHLFNYRALLDMDNISGITSVELVNSRGIVAGFANLNATQAAAITVKNAVVNITAQVKGAATNGQLDTVTMTFSNGDAIEKGNGIFMEMEIDSPNVEAFNFIAVDNVEFANTETMAQWSTINFSGPGDIDFTTNSQSITERAKITASGTGSITIDAQASTGFGANVTTGAGDDVIKMASQDLMDVISAGAGNDMIYANGSGGNVSADIITTGSGKDTVFLAQGLDALLANIDRITDLDFGAQGTTVDTLVFAGLDAAAPKVVVNISDVDQASISAQIGLSNALLYVIDNFAKVNGNASIFTYDSEQYLVVNGSNTLVEITGVTGVFDVGDFSFG